ncbi:MAG: DNA polymerase I, partial [Alphaproteobacteria bacterium]|nr:DNA polymerase I [Alphaproteobacteria bacterium]
PLDNNISSLIRPHRDIDRLSAFLSQQGFNSLLASISAQTTPSKKASLASGEIDTASPASAILPPHVDAPLYELVTTIDALARWIDEAGAQGFVAIDAETTSLNASSASLVGVALATAPGKACYIPLRHVAPASEGGAQAGLDFVGDVEVAETVVLDQIDEAEALALLRDLCADPSILKIGHNLKYDAHVLSLEQNGGLSLGPVDDTMCLSYVLDAGRTERHGLDYLALSLLDIQTIKYQDVCGKGAKQISFAEVAPEAACAYASEDADITLRLWTMLKPRLAREGMSSVYERLERPLIPILAHMEAAGIKVNTQLLHDLSQDFAGRIQILEDEIHQLAGVAFNIASPKQLGEILFEKLGYEGGKKSKTGAFSTGADILEDMAANGIEIAKKVLDYRQLAKLKSTYTDALMASVNKRTGRVHTSFSMVGASTGRLSSSDPNLQNIPIRTQEGRQIRGAFIARPGYKLISADYSQIELRLVAHVAQEQTMLEAFRNGVDIHAQTASEVFGVPLDQMDAETRRRSKAINFGIVYGISGFGLARQLSIPQSEARDYIATYLDRFPGIRTYMNDAREFAREHLYVETLFGRRIHIEQIGASNQAMRGFSERQAINAPIQGSAADIIKRAMVDLPEELSAQGLPADMLLQVHDELIFEVPEEQAEQSVQLIKSVMENAALPIVQLSVPLVVDAGIADSWSEAH